MKLTRFKLLITRYLDGKLSTTESKQVDDWYDAVAQESSPVFDSRSHRSAVKAAITAGLPMYPHKPVSAVRKLSRSWYAAAAALLICLSIAGLVFRQQLDFAWWSKSTALNTVATQQGQLRELHLPDSSAVFLSGNAQLRFDPHHFKNERQIFLDQGEAFFQVQRDSLHPFAITADGLSITVLGTSFNVSHSTASNRITVAVKTGKVRVNDQQGKASYILTAGKSLHYDKVNQTFELFDSNPDYANVWTQGGIVLQGATFPELQELMRDRYGLELRSADIDTHSFRYSLFIPNVQSVEQILQMICSIHQINFRRENNEIILYK